MSEREDNVYIAKTAEKLDRYEDMMEAMKIVANLDIELSIEERNLLSIAFKSAISTRQSALRKLIILENEENKNPTSNLERLQVYRLKIEKELCDICGDMLLILDRHIIQYASAIGAKVFYIKLKGDYHRYLAEFTRDEQKVIATENALAAYEAAREIAIVTLAPSHPARLSVALNFGVFYSEILNSPDQAYCVSKLALDEATSDLRPFSTEECSKDTILFMRMLRDNIKMWSKTNDVDEPNPQGSQSIQPPFAVTIWPSKDKQIPKAINDDEQKKLLKDDDDSNSQNIDLNDIEDTGSTHLDIYEQAHARNSNIQDMETISAPALDNSFQRQNFPGYLEESLEALDMLNIDDMDSNLDFDMLDAGDQVRRNNH